jgi:hypothetical protein
MLQRFGETLPEREVKFAPCDLKSVEADGTFTGYASLFNEVDLGQELKIHAILKRAGRFEIPSNGVVELPAARVPSVVKDGFSMPFNNLLLAVTDREPNPLFFHNPDGDTMIDPLASEAELKAKPASEFKYEKIAFVSALKLRKLLPAGGSAIQLDAPKALQK